MALAQGARMSRGSSKIGVCRASAGSGGGFPGAGRPLGMGRPSNFTVHRPYFNTTSEVHAAVTDAIAPGAPTLNGGSGAAAATNGRAGFVPGRAVLEVPGWQDSLQARTAPATSSSALGPLPSRLRIFSGTSNTALAAEVASYLGTELGKIKIKRFADGEIYVQVGESIRGADVFLVQPTSPPVNDHFMELAVMIDACRRASARSITAVIPYYGYARADRKTQGRESIAAKLTANLITEAGADRVLAMDLHSGQTVGYFDIPVDHVYGESVILDYLASKRIATGELVVVSPDVGGVARARAFAKKLNDAPLAIVDKRRSAHNVSEVMNLIGDVRGKVAVLVDDMIDTAGTITNSAKVLRQEGARAVYACATHAVFSPPAVERLSSGVFEEVIVTNTISMHPSNVFPELTVLSVANLLGETIWRVHSSTSVQALRD
ncbi:ribose-phosphate pyrophosphokinase [Raphidocelis subcapitata]|uniref:ribose-phosphate diphosphokinase n=1 Tax=Raphidocelis subcapitata TaxID=307507 RepID=A0A2V0P3X2_9CHLO|nr:ribose-phosphate pyrophosphokinase [Raphidocelis subcapitata]|eukprot:GBF94556.1 ribose-phosphate pyrophosphokinase [Raphidocelis subcapitata]